MKQVTIKRCCASCQQREVEKDGTRICTLMQIVVKHQFVCSRWQANKQLANVRLGGGKVKRYEYLMFMQAFRIQEQIDIEQGLLQPEDEMPAEELRKRFESETGLSPYVIY